MIASAEWRDPPRHWTRSIWRTLAGRPRPTIFTTRRVSDAVSLMHLLNFAVDKATDGRCRQGRQAPAGTGARLTHVADLKLDKLSVASLANTDWLLDGAWIDMKSAFNPDGRSARVAQDAGGGADEAISLSAAAVPEPDGWMQLLCGLVVVAFMARRRTNLAAG